MAPHTNTLWATLLMEELRRGGVTQVCISPGSRSAPLTVAAARNGKLRVHVHHDERSAAFFALGIAKATGEPAALVCTSGTAAANYLPAIVEASSSQTPMVVLTADRPPELRFAGAAQTIDQIHLYGGFVRFFVDLPVPEASAPLLRALASTAAHALAKARGIPAGPVHLNVPFREPLAPVESDRPLDPEVEAFLASRASEGEPQLRVARSMEPDEETVASLAALLAPAKRGLIVCGPGRSDDRLARAIRRLGERAGFPVISDIASSAGRVAGDVTRDGRTAGEATRDGRAAGAVADRGLSAGVVAHHDLVLRAGHFARIAPEIILELGSLPASKALQRYLDRDGITRIRIQDHGERIDPDHRVRRRFECSPAVLLERLEESLGNREISKPWNDLWSQCSRVAAREVAAALEKGEAPLEAEAIVRAVNAVPAGGFVYLANSMPVRDADAFVRDLPSGVRVLVNRGANGIDGLVSSAAGAAAASGRPVLLVSGDLALFHDTNGLAALKESKAPVVVLVLNNGGGGIFSFLPIAEFDDVFEPYFGTPHRLEFEHAAALHGIAYAKADSGESAERAVKEAFTRGVSSLVEVPGDRTRNVGEHRALFAKIAAALDAEVSWPA